MHSNKTVLIITLIIIFVKLTDPAVASVQEPATFFGSLEEFITGGKKVQVVIRDGVESILLIPRKNAKIVSEEDEKILYKDRIYLVKPTLPGRTHWTIQVLATASKKKAEAVSEQLLESGYQNVILINKGDLTKVRIGKFKSEEAARDLEKLLQSEGWNTWIVKSEQVFREDKISLYNGNMDLIITGNRITVEGPVELDGELYPDQLEIFQAGRGLKVTNNAFYSSVLKGMVSCYSGRVIGHNQVFQDSDYQALKAMAVAVRTELLYQVITKNGGPLILPAYKGIVPGDELVDLAVNSTSIEVLHDSGELTPISFNLGEARTLAESEKNYTTILQYLNRTVEIVDLNKMVLVKNQIEATITWGLQYKEVYQLTWSGPRVITILDLDLKRKGLYLEPVLAGGEIAGLGDLGEIVKERKALAGVNGGYFSYSGRPLGLLMKDGIMISEPIKNRTALGITGDKEVVIEQVSWQGIIEGEDGYPFKITGVNRGPAGDELVIFNSYYGERTPSLKEGFFELIIENGQVIKLKTGPDGKGSIIPSKGYIIRGRKVIYPQILQLAIGTQISYKNDFTPDWEKYELIAALGAGPGLIEDGKISITSRAEEFQPDISYGRAPRSALGVTGDNHLIIITVDGRQPDHSVGVTLGELAEMLLSLGVKDAMNLDGGGSARMIVRGFTMNRPSDKRYISNGLIIGSFFQ